MDIVVIVLVICALAVMIFKKFSSFVYYIAMVDIFLRILDFFSNNIPFKFITDFLNTYFPSSVEGIIKAYSSGIFTTVLMWLLVILYICFDAYIIRAFFKKK